jgi:hypothetical protein
MTTNAEISLFIEKLGRMKVLLLAPKYSYRQHPRMNHSGPAGWLNPVGKTGEGILSVLYVIAQIRQSKPYSKRRMGGTAKSVEDCLPFSENRIATPAIPISCKKLAKNSGFKPQTPDRRRQAQRPASLPF